LRRVVAAIAALCALLGATAALAAPADSSLAYRPACHLSSTLDAELDEVVTSPNWRCDGHGWSNKAELVWLKFDPEQWRGTWPPTVFYSHITKLSGTRIITIQSDGSKQAQSIPASKFDIVDRGPFFSFEMPSISPSTKSILIGIEKPHNVTVLTKAKLARDLDGAGWSLVQILIVALVLGLLLAPICFDLAFYAVLREKFVLLHFAMAMTMAGYVLLAGNLIGPFFSIPPIVLAIGAPLSWAISTSMAVFFITSFLEPGSLPNRTKRMLHIAGPLILIVSCFFSLQIDATRSYDNTGYFLSLTLLIGTICFAVVQAVINGSRSARFLAVAWAPVILASIDRLLRGLGFYVGPAYVDQLLFIALGLEVILITLGVADRFLIIKRQRDRAVSEVRVMEDLADRDALTGLLNRRAIELRFSDLRERGFDTVAIIDLDRFKEINDRFGHQAGDAVLQACASALQTSGSRDTIAARLGGEEFMLLLRGKNARNRAETFRRSITARIASDVEGLDRPITASMGVIEIPRNGFKTMRFDELYARADKLLYEAKEAGRNRTMSERLQGFAKHLRGRAAA